MAEFLARYALGSLWSLIWHFGIIVGIAILALAWAWFMPIYKKTALWVAFTAMVIFFIAGTYTKLGADYVKARWDAAVVADLKRAANARSQAERDIPPLVDIPNLAPSPGAPGFADYLDFNGRLPNDKFDRDGEEGSVRAVGRNKLQPKVGHSKDGKANPRPQSQGADSKVLVRNYSCWEVRWAMRVLPQSMIDSYKKGMTPAQLAAAQKCLSGPAELR
jgi:hypothetical protein